MRLLLSIFLTMLCLFLSTAPVLHAGPATNTTTNTNTSQTPVITNAVSTDYTETPSASITVSTLKSSTAKDQTGQGSQSTTPPQSTEHGTSSANLVVTLLLIFLAIILLLVLMYRWYKRNPDRRSFRGLLDSMVESVQLARTTIQGCLQSPQKQTEEQDDDDEVVEMERGDGGEKTEEGIEGGDERQDEEESDSDDTSEKYSPIDSTQIAEDKKQTEVEVEGERSSKKEIGDTEEMTSVTLEEEDKAEPEEVDDLTPL